MSGAGIYRPANAPLFNPAAQRFRAPLDEIVFSYPGLISGVVQSGLWVPIVGVKPLHIVATMRVPRRVFMVMDSSEGLMMGQYFDESKLVNSFKPLHHDRIPYEGWVRVEVDAKGHAGEDLVISLRYAEDPKCEGIEDPA